MCHISKQERSLGKGWISMRKIILMMLLSFVSSSAIAEWVKVGRGTDGIYYTDPTSLRRAGNRVKMWILRDNYHADRESTDKPSMSMKAQNEYDCKEEKSRILYTSYYSGNMGGGNAVHAYSNYAKEWLPCVPESMSGTLWELACGKRRSTPPSSILLQNT